MKIFVVDDDPLGLATLRGLLEGDGYRVEAFAEPDRLLGRLSKEDPPDLVITDLYMPVIDGLALLTLVRRDYPELPVVIITSSRALELTVQAINLGAYGFLLKPIVTEELRLMIQRLENEIRLRRRVDEEEARLIHAQRLAEIGTLASGIAHEINNPNCFIRGNIDLVERLWGRLLPALEGGNDQRRRMVEFARRELPSILEAMRHGSDRITAIVKSLALYSREENHPVRAGNLRKAIEQACVILNNKLGTVAFSVEDEAPGLGPLAVAEIHLEQMLINLLSNAADAVAGRADPRITARIRPLSPEQVRIDVIDNGTGIDEGMIGLLDAPFFTTKKQGQGTGLGLYITQQLASRAGGSLTYRNNAERGATFSLTLPIRPPDRSSSQEKPHEDSARG